MISGTTKSGFKFKISKARLENYELIESLSEVDENPLLLPKTVNLLLGKEQAVKLKDHLRDKEGLVPTDKLTDEIMEIFQSRSETKNSLSLPE
jgi:hypothetical protein